MKHVDYCKRHDRLYDTTRCPECTFERVSILFFSCAIALSLVVIAALGSHHP